MTATVFLFVLMSSRSMQLCDHLAVTVASVLLPPLLMFVPSGAHQKSFAVTVGPNCIVNTITKSLYDAFSFAVRRGAVRHPQSQGLLSDLIARC